MILHDKSSGWRRRLAICFFFIQFIPNLTAHSTRPGPIGLVYQVPSASIRVLPRHVPSDPSLAGRPISSILLKRSASSPVPSQLLHNDSLLLTFSVSPHSNSLSNSPPTSTFTLSLRPTPNLIHPNAKINYYSAHSETGQPVRTQVPLRPESVLAYSGWVVDSDHVQDWWNEELASIDRSPHWISSQQDPRVLGWARILVHQTAGMKADDDFSQLSFEGSFEADGQLWHIKPYQTYQNIRSAVDPDPGHRADHLLGGLVAWRHSSDQEPLSSPDALESQANQSLPGVLSPRPPSSCSHDQLPFNTDPTHPVFSPQKSLSLQPGPSFASFAGTLSISPILDGLLGLPSLRPPRLRTFNQDPDFGSPPSSSSSHLFRRQIVSNDMSGLGNVTGSNFISSIGITTGCPVGAQVVFIGVASDCTYTSKHINEDGARTAILNNVNSASALFQRTFNISLGVVELNVQSPRCPSTPPPDTPWNVGCPESGPSGLDLNSRLSVFSQWRGNKGGGDGAGLWHLMTNCSTRSEVGVAWLGQLCQTGSRTSASNQVTSGTGVTASSTSEWQVMAHEIGHNFGAIHDCASGCDLSEACCPLSASACNTNDEFLMAPIATRSTTAFSPCSIGNICSSLKNSLNTSCLVAPGQRSVISLQQCGNGIVEPGEDCDPGWRNSTCCNPQTCKFIGGAVCDPANGGCCTPQCQFSSSGTICRPAVNPECDKAETCTGSSARCPSDGFAENGKKCGAEGAGLSCAGGLCTSRDEQCRAQGSSLRLQKSCASSVTMDCQVSCVDPTGRADCILLNSNFVDGTSCGYGGRCSGGVCQSGSFKDTARSWFESNLGISIPIAIVAGVLGLMILWAIFRCFSNRVVSCLRPNRTRGMNAHQPRGPDPGRRGFGASNYGPQLSQPTAAAVPRNQQSWVDPTAWNGR